MAGSAVPGVGELLADGVDGQLFPDADDETLANILEQWCREPERAQRLAHAARARALQEFSLQKMSARYETLFERLQAGLPALLREDC